MNQCNKNPSSTHKVIIIIIMVNTEEIYYIKMSEANATCDKKKCGAIFITATQPSCGKALVSLGVIDIVLRSSAKVCFFRPIIQTDPNKGNNNSNGQFNNDYFEFVGPDDNDTSESHDEDIDLIINYFHLDQTYEESYGVRTDEANALLGQDGGDDVIETIIRKFKNLEQNVILWSARDPII